MIDTLQSVLVDQIKDLYNAENQLVRALPELAKKASTRSLRQAIESHLDQTSTHVDRLNSIAEILKIKPDGKTCWAMQGLIEEGKEVLEQGDEGPAIDVALIAAAQRVEHYEIAAYGNARAIAEELGEVKVVELLQQTLDEEKAADKKLTEICEKEVFAAAAHAIEPDDAHRKHLHT